MTKEIEHALHFTRHIEWKGNVIISMVKKKNKKQKTQDNKLAVMYFTRIVEDFIFVHKNQMAYLSFA